MDTEPTDEMCLLRDDIRRLTGEISAAQKQLAKKREQLQAICDHPNSINVSNGGNRGFSLFCMYCEKMGI